MPKTMRTHFILGFLIFTAITSSIFTLVANAQSVRFNFSSFAAGENGITLRGDAIVSNNGIDLTKNFVGENLQSSYGRAYYGKSVPLWDKASKSIASFSTSFQFIIKEVNRSGYYGDGLAFFMQNPANANALVGAGGWIGLVNESSNGNASNQIVAVEFDTYKNDWDPDSNHVGIDVNNITSKAVVTADYLDQILGMEQTPGPGLSLRDRTLAARIDYDGQSKTLHVFLSNSSTVQGDPILSFGIDLSKFLPESIDVGFAAATGSVTGTNRVISWNFSSVSSWSNADISPSESPRMSRASPSYIPRVSPLDPAHRKKNRIRLIIIILITVFLFTGFCVSAYFFNPWHMRRRRRRMLQQSGESTDEIEIEMRGGLGHAPGKFTYTDLAAATKNFSEDGKLGQGGFGGVYKGILADTREAVAVKRISQGSTQGKKEYISEVTIINRIRHRNLVQLLGWCHERGELLLVYEYLPNGSLDKHLFEYEREPLDWKRRYGIASGLASALVYLHEEGEQCVVHRDVKSSNVMLDYNFTAKLGDFGLARLVEHELEPKTTVLAGTFGYLAPECARTRRATRESDVFSFGAVALEIASGMRVLDKRLKDYNMRLVEWVWDLYGRNRVLDAADQRLAGDFNVEEMEQLLVMGLWCSHPDPKSRPTIRQALKTLKFEALLPQLPPKEPVAIYALPLQPDYSFSTTSSYQSSSNMLSSSHMSILSGSSSGVFARTHVQHTLSSSWKSGNLSSKPILFHQDTEQ
eukprot:Gb_11056 [translate_table: standard]